MLTNDDKKRLLEIARQTVASVAAGRGVPRFDEKSPGLNLKRGVFVTLTRGRELRGCIGLFGSDEPLYQTVPQMARAACRDDYRFSPIVSGEVPQINISISVLTQPTMIDDWHKIRLGVDGVIVRRGASTGVFLPQVATETGWDLTTFLGELCSQKAGLPPDSYTDPQTKIFIFQAG